MRDVMTKSMARNIFYGGSLFFILIFVGLTAHSHYYITTTSTNTATLKPGVTESQVRAAVESAFADEEFITVLPAGEQPSTGETVHTNLALVQVAVDERANRAVVTVAIDNLGKGTASAAIQSLNIALGFPEGLGLTTNGVTS